MSLLTMRDNLNLPHVPSSQTQNQANAHPSQTPLCHSFRCIRSNTATQPIVKNVLGRSRRLPQTHSRPCPAFQTFRLALLAPPNAIKANSRFAFVSHLSAPSTFTPIGVLNRQQRC
ncbi:hypothetical protein HBI24_166820 [Parastagonospora nodorum]|nr:hypothetical protein HBI95_234610 [Parastagonospora nodorum]KAH5487409.1 hypothetical protein HBI52_237960 [Parastagonospora nodorum]KAH5578249.1 hypothetical protein HBI24_166820 [Parastagonospora nodorum]KAH6381015.1 hypothetical protein HBI14_238460 [Parastagonospora nodorum]